MTGHPFFDSGLLRGCGLGAFRAVILDFRPRLANRCKVLPVYTPLRASILDFKPRFGNRCSIVEGRRQGQDATPLYETDVICCF